MKGQIVTLMVHLVSNKGQVSCYSLTVCLFPRLQEAMSIADVTGQQLIQFVITAQYWERHRQLLWQTNNWKLHKLQGFWVFLEGFGFFEWFFFPKSFILCILSHCQSTGKQYTVVLKGLMA